MQSYPAQVTNVVLCPPWHSYYLVIFCVSICYGDIYLNHYPMWLPFSLTIIPMRPGIDPMALLIVSSGIECSVSLTHFEYSSKFSLVMILFNISFVMLNIFPKGFMSRLRGGIENICAAMLSTATLSFFLF